MQLYTCEYGKNNECDVFDECQIMNKCKQYECLNIKDSNLQKSLHKMS